MPLDLYYYWYWIGIGFKDQNEPDLSMGHSDLWTIDFETLIIDDRFGNGNRHPKSDTTKEGVNDLSLISEYQTETTHSFTFSRLLDTGDACDLKLVKDQGYIIMWAFGNKFKGGLIPHTGWNRGREFLILSENYADDDSDEDKSEGNGSYTRPENFFTQST